MKRFRCRGSNPRAGKVDLDRHGAVSVPLILLVSILVTTSLGTIALMDRWRNRVATQLRMDRCVGETALELKKKLERISKANQRIRQLRIAAAAAIAVSPDKAAFIDMAIDTQVALQEETRVAWDLSAAAWLAKGGCQHGRDWAEPLTFLNWTRGLPDAFGAQALDLSEDLRDKYRVVLHHPPCHAAAEVQNTSSESKGTNYAEILHSMRWRAHWSPP